MKKYLILFIVFFQFTLFFGQNSDWASYGTISCYQGLQGSCKNLGYVKSINEYAWNVRIKNNYSKKAHVTFYYSIGGEKISVGLVSINPGGIYTHTSLYVKNNSSNYNITVESVCFAKSWGGCGSGSSNEMCFADCDQGTPNIPTDCGAGSKVSTTNDSQLNDSDIKKAKAEEEYKAKVQKEADEKAAREQKERDDKTAQYNKYIQDGDNAMSSKQYSSAMSYYSQAKSYAQTSNETSEADRKYSEAFEAKKTAERTERVQKVQANDVVKDVQYAGLTASFVGLAAFLKDSYSPKWYAMKFQLGLGLESFPLISNNVNKYHWDQTYIESFTVPTFHIGLKSGFFNNKGISLEVNPQFNLGFSALSPGKSGGYLEYGSTGALYFGKKGYSIFKIFLEAGYFKRSGIFNYDYDAANAQSDGTLTTKSDDVREGIFNHGKIKYGAGIMLRWINDEGKETFVRPAVYYEKASFFEPDTKPVLNMNLQVNISSEIIIELTYVKNYYIPGEVKYPITLTKENMNFWGIKLIRQGKLF